MKLDNEKKVEMVELDVTFTDDEAEKFITYARKYIVNDEAALINWAINDMLLKQIKKLEKNIEKLKSEKDGLTAYKKQPKSKKIS